MSFASRLALPCAPFPPPLPVLEDVAAATPRDVAAALAFALGRCRASGAVMAILPRRVTAETGWPSLHGLVPWLRASRLLLVMPRTANEALWAMEQALKSGALGGVVAQVEGAALTATMRLDFAAQHGVTPGFLLHAGGGLSAARRRWRVRALPGAAHPDDPAAPGRPRLQAELLRQRGGAPGDWVLEHDAASGGFAVVDGVAVDRVAAPQRHAA